jgi:hypothetical protein
MRKLFPLFMVIIPFAIIVFLSYLLFAGWQMVFSERITIVWNTDPVLILTYHRPTERVQLLSIPGQTYMMLPNNRGSYRISALWVLGELEKKKGAYLKDATQYFFGAPVMHWVGFQSPMVLGTDDTPVKMLRQLTSYLAPVGSKFRVFTSLNMAERLMLWWWLGHVRNPNVLAADLAQELVLTPTVLADGTEVMVANPQLVDKLSQKYFWENSVRSLPVFV